MGASHTKPSIHPNKQHFNSCPIHGNGRSYAVGAPVSSGTYIAPPGFSQQPTLLLNSQSNDISPRSENTFYDPTRKTLHIFQPDHELAFGSL